MLPITEREWTGASEAERLRMLKSLEKAGLCEAARTLDWSRAGPSVLRWISAQRDVDLGTAMTLFLNGEPSRFNHADRDTLNEADRARCAVLDALCQRINCGYYLPDPRRQMTELAAFRAWMEAQDRDRMMQRRGRWVFNPIVVAPMISEIRFDSRRRHRVMPVNAERGLLKGLISPFFA